MPSVSVVIPTFNRCAQLDATLDEVLANTAPAEVVVVDDGSTDGTAAMLRRRAAAEPRLRPAIGPNRGDNRARLEGARAASGDVVLLLDDDVVPAPGIVAGHARHHAEDPALVVAGYMPVPAGPTDARSYPRDIYARAYEEHCRAWEAAPDSVLRTLWAGHLSLRRDAFLALAADLAGDRVLYHADLDLGLRCIAAGLHGRFDRTLGSRHLYERSTDAYGGDAAKSGRGMADAHARHPDVLGPPDPAFAVRDQPRPVAWLVGRSGTATWPRRLVGAAIPALGALRLYRPQRFAAGLLWKMEQLRTFTQRSEELRA